MSRFIPNRTPCGHTRREFLWQLGGGFAGVALTDMLATEALAASPLAEKLPHFAAKAKHCVFLFMNGGPSQVDTFDPKPALTKHHGQPYTGDAKVGSNGRAVGHLMRSPFEFQRHGRSGLEISSLFPHLATHADDLCVVRSMFSDTAAHASGCLQMNTGSIFIGKPSLGSWLNYGLGTLNHNLPGFVVMTELDGGVHAGGISGHVVPQRRVAVARSCDAGGHQRPHAASEPGPVKIAQRGTLEAASGRG